MFQPFLAVVHSLFKMVSLLQIRKEKNHSTQMCRGTFLLKHFTILICFQISQTCYARMSKHCTPSACGHIHSITYPFRLTTDPRYCGKPKYELVCEGNQTFISIFSKKLYVQSINYDNHTIHLVDPALQKEDICSLVPQLTLKDYNSIFETYYYYPYVFVDHSIKIVAEPIFMLNCSFAINTSTSFLEITGCKSKHTYLKIGEMNASEVTDGCRVEFIALTSWPIPDGINISFSDFDKAISYGFELYYSKMEQWISIIQWIIWLIKLLPSFFTLYLGARFVICLPIVMVFLMIKFKRRHLSMFQMIEGFLQTQNNFMPIRYKYSHLKRMTRGFKVKLGEGGYGSVYKGKLRSGRDVAVKMLSKPKAGGQDFMNEVATIGRIHHVNVVGLVGYCVERSKCALLYDFMPNGSLEKYITCQEGSPLLSWQRKYEIVLGVARGIEYLHRGCDIQILHFDIKPHNILLDENFIPKISDFGLAKLYPTDNSIVTLTAARGTIGYVAPELINRSIGAISYKADVYSFGMLLMEMLDLKRNVLASEENSSQYFPSWIYDKLNKGKEIDLVDVEANDDEKKISRKMTLVALWCIQTNPLQRPSMSKVVEMLEGEVEVVEIPPQPIYSQPIVPFHQIMESCTTFSSDSMALLENSITNSVE